MASTPSRSFTASKALFDRANQSIPGGVDSPVRAYRSVGLTPPFLTRAKGARLWDADGNEYIDYVGSWGPMLLGHADDKVLDALIRVAKDGTSFGAPSELEVRLAEMVKDAVPSVEMVRFVNSGSEASMGALRVARGFTGRDKVIKFAGCYHGSIDPLLVKAGSGATTLGVPDSAGVPAGAAQDTLVADFNNLDSVQELVDGNSGQIAAIILELIPGNMGVVTPEHRFLEGLRAICDREGILLIADEVMTGFRVARGGAQALLSVQPDLSIFGKVIGGGFPVGAYGGRRDIMSKVAPLGPVYQAGTLSGNPVAMAAGIATLERLDDGLYADLAEKCQRVMEAWQAAAAKAGHPITTCWFGGMMGFFFSRQPVRDYATALESDKETFVRFFKGMLNEGIYLAPSPFEALFMSTAHGEAELKATIAAGEKVLASLA